jgi:hypothetical protein
MASQLLIINQTKVLTTWFLKEVACSEAGDKTVACSSPRIEDSRRQWYDGV